MNPAENAHAVVVTSVDSIATIVVILIIGVSLLTLVGMGAMMAIGAVFSNRPLVTSWPSDQEHAFAVFEAHGSGSNSRAWVFSFLGAGLVAVAAVGIYFGVAPEKKDLTKGMNMSNIQRRSTKPAASEAARPDAPGPAAAEPAKPEATAPAVEPAKPAATDPAKP
jgi:hypothetical protein